MGSGHSSRDYFKIAWERQGGRCFYCGVHMIFGSSKKRDALSKRQEPALATLEHRTPKSMGGNALHPNGVIVCLACNKANN